MKKVIKYKVLSEGKTLKDQVILPNSDKVLLRAATEMIGKNIFNFMQQEVLTK